MTAADNAPPTPPAHGPAYDPPGTGWTLVAAVSFFVTGAFAGFFLTGLPTLTPATWRLWVGARLLWQLGGAIWFGWAVAGAVGEPRWKGAAIAAALGLVLTVAPALDMVRGPLTIDGAVVEATVDQDYITQASGGRSPTISMRLAVADEEGRRHAWTLRGRQANLWTEEAADYLESGTIVRVRVLRHLKAVIELGPRPRPRVDGLISYAPRGPDRGPRTFD